MNLAKVTRGDRYGGENKQCIYGDRGPKQPWEYTQSDTLPKASPKKYVVERKKKGTKERTYLYELKQLT